MYVGRFVVAGPGIGAYRVSSRSFPNREITDRGGIMTVGPPPDAPETDNPYIAYNCARAVEPGGQGGDPRVAVIGNGSHVDPITEKLSLGYPARDALLVEAVREPTLAATYEKDSPEGFAFDAGTAREAAREAYGLPFEHAVCAAGVAVDESGVEFAIENG